MTFVDTIISEGFVEQGQKELLSLVPHKRKWIPDWWNHYNTRNGWLGLDVDHPDAWFRKEGVDKELKISLQGMLMPIIIPEKFWPLLESRSIKYICLKVGKNIIYETFAGKIPDTEVIKNFLIDET